MYNKKTVKYNKIKNHIKQKRKGQCWKHFCVSKDKELAEHSGHQDKVKLHHFVLFSAWTVSPHVSTFLDLTAQFCL